MRRRMHACQPATERARSFIDIEKLLKVGKRNALSGHTASGRWGGGRRSERREREREREKFIDNQ